MSNISFLKTGARLLIKPAGLGWLEMIGNDWLEMIPKTPFFEDSRACLLFHVSFQFFLHFSESN